MKNIIVSILVLASTQLFSQEAETVRIKKSIVLKGVTDKEKYFALKSDTSIRHGEYKRYNSLNDLIELGYYNMGIKDSIWQTYTFGKMVNSVGHYKNGNKEGLWNFYTNIPGSWKPTLTKSGFYFNNNQIGIWTYYQKNGEVEQKYDHTNDSLIFISQSPGKNKCLIKTNTSEKLIELERPPILIGGSSTEIENWKKMDSRELNRLSKGQEDFTYELSFWIKTNGDTYGYEMVKGVNIDYDNYIIDYYKNNYKWIPGLLDGKNVECKITVSDGYVVKM